MSHPPHEWDQSHSMFLRNRLRLLRTM
jgi:hypothetical protein